MALYIERCARKRDPGGLFPGRWTQFLLSSASAEGCFEAATSSLPHFTQARYAAVFNGNVSKQRGLEQTHVPDGGASSFLSNAFTGETSAPAGRAGPDRRG